jgi:hydroxymethylpyrimidine/phosphomethylpyrimidine kinase
MRGRVLVVAGSDSGAGAGIQADIKTIASFGAYATTAITALTAQNTVAVLGIAPVAPEFVALQMRAVLSDIGADVVKTGMLASARIIDAVADTLAAEAPTIPLVVDPVMVASSGARLLDEDATETLRRRLIARARVVTPNVPEAEILCRHAIGSLDDMRRAADRLLREGAQAVVLKGGHLAGAVVHDLAASGEGSFVIEAPRRATRSTHGTGCTLASAIAASLAQGLGFREAVERAHIYVQRALAAAPGLGQGNGPLDHTVSAD